MDMLMVDAHFFKLTLVISTLFSACFIWRNCVGSEGDVWEVWGWFSCSFCIKRISICTLPSKSGRAVLSKVEGIILYNLFILYFPFILFPWFITRYCSYGYSLIFNHLIFYIMLYLIHCWIIEWNWRWQQVETCTRTAWNCDLNLVSNKLSIQKIYFNQLLFS